MAEEKRPACPFFALKALATVPAQAVLEFLAAHSRKEFPIIPLWDFALQFELGFGLQRSFNDVFNHFNMSGFSQIFRYTSL